VTCDNCDHLQHELDRAQNQNRRLREAIKAAAAQCQLILAEHAPVIAQSSGVPRGAWSFSRGAYETALAILQRLST